ncbi:RNA-directed DNA polymerase, eukaryota [Tanacetum coccineum]
MTQGFNNKNWGRRDRSKEDDVGNLSQSIFVTNFPASCGKKELWEVGAKHGAVVDVFVANRMSKAGKRFAFIRFIRVKDVDRLVSLLRGEWIGSFHLFASKPRFARDITNKGIGKGHEKGINFNQGGRVHGGGQNRSYVNVVKGKANETKDPIEKKVVKVIMLDSSKPLLEYVGGAKAVFAKVKHLHSIPNLKALCMAERFLELSLKYVGGLWVLIEFQTASARNSFLNHKGMHNWLSKVIPWSRSFVPRERLIWLDIEGIPLVAWSLDSLKRVAGNWGEVVYLDEEQEDNYYSARLCVESQFSDFIMKSVEVDVEGKRYEVRVKEVTGWIPSFKKEEHKHESEEVNQPQAFEKQGEGDDDSEEDMDDEFLADTFAKEEEDTMIRATYKMNKEHGTDKSNPDFPPGFTPVMATTAVENDQLDEASSINQQNERERWRTTSGGENYNEKSENVANSFRCSQPNNVVGFSILNRLEEAIQFGKALGIDMDGCADDMEKLINGIGAKGMQETKMSRMDLVTVRMVWGNSRFDFASSSARGLSGGILCVWDPEMFVKSQIVSHDHFVAVEGVWKIGNLRMQFITVYAPQDANANFLLWYRLQILISRFNGESIIMGDFNVVRVPEERMGSEFNINMAESFNNFIMENDLVDVSLGGYQFTWVNSLATKMSKIDRFLISGGLLERFPNLAGTILDKGVPDHRPILLKEAKADYGPIPFRFFHSWLDCDGFDV